jgi:hypothetical protein
LQSKKHHPPHGQQDQQRAEAVSHRRILPDREDARKNLSKLLSTTGVKYVSGSVRESFFGNSEEMNSSRRGRSAIGRTQVGFKSRST